MTSNHSGGAACSSASSCVEVQIVGGRHALQAELVLEIIRRQPVGDVEREIADAPVVREELQVIVVADQVAVGLAGADLFERPFLAHLEDARRSDEDCGVARLRMCRLQPRAV